MLKESLKKIFLVASLTLSVGNVCCAETWDWVTSTDKASCFVDTDSFRFGLPNSVNKYADPNIVRFHLKLTLAPGVAREEFGEEYSDCYAVKREYLLDIEQDKFLDYHTILIGGDEDEWYPLYEDFTPHYGDIVSTTGMLENIRDRVIHYVKTDSERIMKATKENWTAKLED